MALYTITGTPPVWPKVHSRSFYPTTQQGRNTIRRFPQYHVPKPHGPTLPEQTYWKETHAAWRRHWQKIFLELWSANNTGKTKAWWTAQAALVQVLTHKGILKNLTGMEFFNWYQARVLDSLLTSYIPFPSGIANFPASYEDPWAPPDLGTPYLVDTAAPAIVTIAYPYDSTLELSIQPIALFALNPPVLETHPRNTIAWTPYSSVPQDSWSHHSYDLSLIFQGIKKGSRGAVVASYGVADMPEPIPATAGPNSTGQGESAFYQGINPWLDPNNIASEQYATCPHYEGTGEYLRATAFGFSTPTDPTILGIKVEFRRSYTATPYAVMNDASVKIVKAGAEVGTEHKSSAYWTTTDTWKSYGSATDLWGTTWTPAQINATNFGASLANYVLEGGEDTTAQCNGCRITIYYEYTPPPTAQQFSPPIVIPFSLP